MHMRHKTAINIYSVYINETYWATKVCLQVCTTTYNAEVSHSIKKHQSVWRKSQLLRVCFHVGLSVRSAHQGAVLTVTLRHNVRDSSIRQQLSFLLILLYIAAPSDTGVLWIEQEVESLMSSTHLVAVTTRTLPLLCTGSHGPSWGPETQRGTHKEIASSFHHDIQWKWYLEFIKTHLGCLKVFI